MTTKHLLARALLLTLVLFAGANAGAAGEAPSAARDQDYPGSLLLHVDASDVDHRVMQVEESLRVSPGALTLFYPRWLPGNHAPTGPIEALTGLRILGLDGSAVGRTLEWRRDTVDMYAFHVTVPPGVSRLRLNFQFASPIAREQGRRVMTPDMLGLQWEKTLLYPAGFNVKRITVEPTLRLPAGWSYASALELAQREGDELRFKPVTLEMLVDSPVFAGRHALRVALDENPAAPVYLNVFADLPAQLQMKPAQLDAHRRLVREALALYGSRHFAHYDFLLALSENFSSIGLEHHQSSENGTDVGYFTEWDAKPADRDLLPHEMTHSWNGKFRRPADLWTPDYNTPMQNSLLWVYEGMTEFWGAVLTARSGLWSEPLTREALAWDAATYGELRKGRAWRALQDTTNQPIMGYHKPLSYPSWQRNTDYYTEGLLLWLDIDMRLRELSKDRHSLDDFVRRFVGMRDGELGPLTYTYDDVVSGLNAVQPGDWNTILRAHLDGHQDEVAATLARAGWQLSYTDKPGEYVKALDNSAGATSLTFSLGMTIRKDGARISDVVWDSPAFRAGLAPAMTIVAVGGRAYSDEQIRDAITAAQKSSEPIEMIVRVDDEFRVVKIDYHAGLRYPHLERIAGRPDRLTTLLTPRTAADRDAAGKARR